jgi:hypothetical protein
MPLYCLSIETDAGSYMHGFHLGTDESIARKCAETICLHYTPRMGTRIATVGLVAHGKLVDVFDGSGWVNAAIEAAK